jgi:ADP-ribose pyrophosphatase
MTGEENPETKLIAHDKIYRGKIVDLMVDTISLPSGKSAIREVVKHPGGVVAIPQLADGSLLLIRQFRYPLQKFIFEFPAGKLDSGQTPIDTMHRELEEETGYRASEMIHLSSFYTSPGFCDEIIHLFLASGLIPVGQRLEDGEHIVVEKFTLDECLRMVESGEIADAKTILGILWYRNIAAHPHP